MISAEKYLEAVGAHLKQKGVTVKCEVRAGSEAEEIIKLATEMNSDMIAMTTHGRSGVGRWAFGGVADKVLYGSQTAVLLVRAPKAGITGKEKGKS